MIVTSPVAQSLSAAVWLVKMLSFLFLINIYQYPSDLCDVLY